MRRLLTGIAGAVLTAVLTVGTADAHSGLDRATPGPGDTARAGLDRIEMEFNGPLDPATTPQVEVLDPHGSDEVAADPVVVDNRLTVHLRSLDAGLHTVRYTATFDDGHRSTGGYYLSVVPRLDDDSGANTWLYAVGGGTVLLLLVLVGVLRRWLRRS
ncbi:copper resistance protein CopC [Saccharopolyspora sp. K220]|uniref:copper resistance CopC family protein n=1 Tax=Saccharopolyspora soli TaxID=2926618 RepID=UPI001F58AA00|nr:copper resistance CopC family protein [Saccharopolyspora soli]MCI2419458.1 copper resistance protein CopC [Saccharopolyspora soli]